MFKFVVLCGLLAVAASEPEPSTLLAAPLGYASTVISPATTTISRQASSVVHPSPAGFVYSAPLAYSHYIKKRSPQYIAASYLGAPGYAPLPYYPAATSYSSTYSAPYFQAPVVHASALPLAATHLIKKRSAPVYSTPYLAPSYSYYGANTYAAPAYSTIGYSSPAYASTYYAGAPILPYASYIKK